MFNIVVHYLAHRLGSDGDDGDEDGGHAGSLLDWSVNYGHGTASRTEEARELAQIQEKAEVLEETERDRR